jgi:hypothetical protein
LVAGFMVLGQRMLARSTGEPATLQLIIFELQIGELR